MRALRQVLPAFLLLFAPLLFAQQGYSLKEGDLLRISVWGETNLDRETTVLPDGSISFPLVGSLTATGATAPELEKRIAEQLEDYIPDPSVSVVVTETLGNRIYILGNVSDPGVYVMTSPINVMQALSLAGGLTTFADKDDIVILRSATEEGSVLRVDYSRILTGKSVASNHRLMAGDTIMVP